MKRIKLSLCALIVASSTFAQNNVGIGTTTPSPDAALEVRSTNQGVLVPRLTTTQRNAITAPTEGLLVYDTDINCFFFYESTGATWQNLCNAGGTGPAGPQGPAGPAGPAGTNGTNGATGPQGPAGATGLAGSPGATGPAGPVGPAGANGSNGTNGVGVTSTVDNGNGTFTINYSDGSSFTTANLTGPAGPAGSPGATGPAGPAGPAGANGTNGATGPQGPSGVVNRYHVYSTAARTGVASTALTIQPGMTQTFTLSAPASVIVWASIGALNTTLTTTGYSTVDMVVHVNGNPLASGGWNRMFITNTSATTGLGICALNTMINLPAGTHTIDLRTSRSSGTSGVTIGGNPTTDVNPGEMTIMILN